MDKKILFAISFVTAFTLSYFIHHNDVEIEDDKIVSAQTVPDRNGDGIGDLLIERYNGELEVLYGVGEGQYVSFDSYNLNL
jgi:hypothetical protein